MNKNNTAMHIASRAHLGLGVRTIKEDIINLKPLENKIEKLEEEPLSTDQVMKLLDGKINYIPYSDIKRYSSIDELLDPYDCCIILYFTAENFGHYVCITKRGKSVEFFDPYGLMIDDELEFVDSDDEGEALKERKNQDYGYLTELLLDSPYHLEFNQYQFQEENDNVNTCGRHCVVRCLMKKMDLEEYKNFILKNIKLVKKITGRNDIDADFIVTMYTNVV